MITDNQHNDTGIEGSLKEDENPPGSGNNQIIMKAIKLGDEKLLEVTTELFNLRLNHEFLCCLFLHIYKMLLKSSENV